MRLITSYGAAWLFNLARDFAEWHKKFFYV